jgi:hypothetical protein
MLRLEKRPSPSRFWTAATPVLAVILTMIAGGLMFALLGKNPFEAIRTIFWDPLFGAVRGLFAAAASGQGGAADPDRHWPGAGVPGGDLEHRGRGAIHHGRDLAARRWGWPSIRRTAG